LVIAQRLVRKLADSKRERPATEAETKYIRGVLEGVPREKLGGISLEEIKLYEPVKSESDPFGYKGRTVIMEQLVVSEEMQAFIRGDVVDVHTEAIEAVAKKSGMLTLEQKGVIAALEGVTTLDEVARVI
jgi:type II secretory ATPase GspE/PulE/Tfp pilus assembly ATPase PilB-like protein